MTKLRNKIVLVLLALCLVACMGITVACGGDDNKKPDNKPVTYTVIVKMDDAPVKGVTVTVKKGGVSYAPKTTGEDGKVEFSLAKADDYEVELDNLPENYEVPEGTSRKFPADRNLTVNIAEKFAYKIKLVNKDGDPFTTDDAEEVKVGICTLSGNCLEAVEPDANGLARIEAAKGDYHIKVYDLPVGYAYECDSNGYSMHQSDEGTYIYEGDDNTYNSLSATENEQTITIYPVNVLDFATMTAMTEDEIAEYNDYSRTITGAKAYKVQMKLEGHQTAYYTFTAECTGTYMLYAIGYQSAAMGYKINPRFLLGDTVASGSGMFNEYGQNIETVKGQQYYINVTALASGLDCEFILTTPVASGATATGAGTVSVTLYKENAFAVIELKPTAGAAFKATVQGETVAAITYQDSEYYDSNASDVFWDESVYQAGAEVEFKFTEDKIGNTIYIAVAAQANAENYPVTLNVKIEKLRDLANTVNTVTTEATLAKYNRPANKELVPLPFDIDAENELVKGEDGYYHYGEDGPIVMVMLTGDLDLDRFSAGGALVYMELSTIGQVNPYVVDVTDWEDRMDLTKGNTYDDYRELLRGFKDYKYDKQNNPSIPNSDDILVEKYYVKYVNEDGAYPLTDELIDILKIIAYQQQVEGMLPMIENYENQWLFACYYYDDYLEPDVIAGEYKFVKFMQYDEWEGSYYVTKVGDEKRGWDMETNTPIISAYTEDDYKLVVNKRGNYTIYQKGFDGYDVANAGDGTWSKTGENYSFIIPNFVENWNEDYSEVTYEDLTYTVIFNATTGRLALVSNQFVWVFQKGGTAKLVEILEDEDGEVMLEVYDNDTFKLVVNYEQVASGTYKPNADGSQIAIAVTDKASTVTTATVVYADGIYTITVDENEYEIDTNEYPQATLLTEDGNTMMEIYDWGLKLLVKDGENWTLFVSGKVVGGDEEHPEVEILESAEIVTDLALEMVVEMNGAEPVVLMKATVTLVDDVEQEFVFDMTEML